MAGNLILGCATMAGCLAIQCVAVSILLRVLFALERRQVIRPTLIGASAVLVAVMLVMLAGNLVQITIWAWLFLARGEFVDFATAFYHSVVNFTTLGYGDLVMSEKGRLLGALEAANGVLMFGLTTGLLFAILNELMSRAWDERAGRGAESPGSLPR
jgi:voltage-gated potassium channel Kch